MIRFQIYRLGVFAARLIPRNMLRRLLRILQLHPEIASRAGYQVFQEAYWNPFPVASEVDMARLKLKRTFPAIEFQESAYLQLLENLTPYAGEVDEFFKSRKGNLVAWDNTYQRADSATLYAMLRRIKPKRYIEVGCGYSSRASAAALRRNEQEGHPCQCTFIEPFPPPYLTEMNLPGEMIPKRIEQMPLAFFQQLEPGDVLFIDTSHVIKIQNDVEFELIHLLPSLKAGVIVHIHDIFTPYDYPEEWMVGKHNNRNGNNEQYALECLLSGGADWEIRLPVHLLWRDHQQAMKKLLPDLHNRPAAFWLEKVEPPKAI
jgi:hypothetical protein